MPKHRHIEFLNFGDPLIESFLVANYRRIP